MQKHGLRRSCPLLMHTLGSLCIDLHVKSVLWHGKGLSAMHGGENEATVNRLEDLPSSED